MRIRLVFHQYKLILPITQDMKAKTVKEFTSFVSSYLQEHFNNKLIIICELTTSDRFALNPSDIVQDVIMDNELIYCLDDQLALDREIKVYCDRKNPWLHVERKKVVKSRRRKSSSAGSGEGNKNRDHQEATTGATSAAATPSKWAEVGYHTRNKLYVMLGVGNTISLFLFSVDELRSIGFQEKRIGIIEDETGDWYTMAKFEKHRPEKYKKVASSTMSSTSSSSSSSDAADQQTGEELVQEPVVVEEDEMIAAIGLHVKAEGDQMANAEQIIIRVTKDGLLTTNASEVVHLFGTKSGKRPRRRRQMQEGDDEMWLASTSGQDAAATNNGNEHAQE